MKVQQGLISSMRNSERRTEKKPHIRDVRSMPWNIQLAKQGNQARMSAYWYAHYCYRENTAKSSGCEAALIHSCEQQLAPPRCPGHHLSQHCSHWLLSATRQGHILYPPVTSSLTSASIDFLNSRSKAGIPPTFFIAILFSSVDLPNTRFRRAPQAFFWTSKTLWSNRSTRCLIPPSLYTWNEKQNQVPGLRGNTINGQQR